MPLAAILTVLILAVSNVVGNIGTKTAKARTTARHLVTAYCLRGTMANGRYVHRGAVAVSNQQYRFGTHFYIPGYGRGTAEDTGSAVGYNHLDVWMASCSAARTWGTRYLPITVVN